jgi:hypothetical protein
MKRIHFVLLAAVACLLATQSISAQLGMNMFKKPNIADIFKPVVGSGGLYETQPSNQQKAPSQLELTIVAKEMVDGQQGYWMEMGHKASSDPGPMRYNKILITNDFQVKRLVIQQPGQPAMEIPFNPTQQAKNNMNDELEKWHQVGSESVTVPAGTFSCVHWKKDNGSGDVWASDKVTPMAMVKMVSQDETMVLVKVINGATDHITGPVTKFDPQAFGRQMRQQPQ